MSNPQNPGITEPERAEKFCSRMAGTIRGLKSVLEKETALIKKHNIGEISQLQNDKNLLSASFQSDIVLLRNEAQNLSRLTPVPLTRLHRDLAGLDKVIQENARSLEAGLAVAESVARRIADKTARMSAGPTTYGANARQPEPRMHGPSAIAIDSKI